MSAGHIAPKSMYYSVFLALIAGTGLTYLAAQYDFGALNNVVMLLSACTKATLVILFFMHVRWSTRLTWVIAASGFSAHPVLAWHERLPDARLGAGDAALISSKPSRA